MPAPGRPLYPGLMFFRVRPEPTRVENLLPSRVASLAYPLLGQTLYLCCSIRKFRRKKVFRIRLLKIQHLVSMLVNVLHGRWCSGFECFSLPSTLSLLWASLKPTWAQCYITFYCLNLQVFIISQRVFVPGKSFQHSLMFASMTGAYTSVSPFRCSTPW